MSRLSFVTICEILFSIPKSLYVGCKLLPMREALRLKCMVKYNVKLVKITGAIERLGGGRFKFGFGAVSEFHGEKSILSIRGKLVLKDSASFGSGSRLIIEPNGCLELGKGFIMTACSTITCWNKIIIGDNCLVSWGIHIADTDFHYTINPDTKEYYSPYGSISIGNGVWIGMRATILKNSVIPDGCIVGANSLVKKRFNENNTLLAGNPAQVKKTNIRLAQKGECPEIWPMKKTKK